MTVSDALDTHIFYLRTQEMITSAHPSQDRLMILLRAHSLLKNKPPILLLRLPGSTYCFISLSKNKPLRKKHNHS